MQTGWPPHLLEKKVISDENTRMAFYNCKNESLAILQQKPFEKESMFVRADSPPPWFAYEAPPSANPFFAY